MDAQHRPARALRVGIVGAGRVGTVLAARLRAAGHVVTAVSGSSDASRLRVQTLLPGVVITTPDDVVARSEVVVLSVPDDSLIAVAEELAPVVRAGQVVLHTSGRHGLEALSALTRRGARAIAFHPAMTFTGTAVDLDRTCVFGVTARPEERPIADALVADLGGTSMWIDEADRALYHASLAHGANHLVTLVAQAQDLLRAAGAADPSAVLRPLLTAALDNALAYGDAALTGPVARGDVTTLRAHAEALAGDDVDEATAHTYVEMARATAQRAEAAGTLSRHQARAVGAVLDEADWDTMADLVVGF